MPSKLWTRPSGYPNDPNNAIVWNNKGNALRMLHRNSDAKAAYAKARELGYSGPMTQMETTV
jgi:Flp pilus assembly protein TadD